MYRNEISILIIRFWHEPAAAGEFILRGSIEHMPTGEKVYFQTDRDMVEKIDRFLSFPSSDFFPDKGEAP